MKESIYSNKTILLSNLGPSNRILDERGQYIQGKKSRRNTKRGDKPKSTILHMGF